MSGIESLEQRIQKHGGLPVFESSLQEILELIRAQAPMGEIAHAVERDPGLAGRVLRLANSAYYGMSREVSTLKMALVLLGARAVRNLVLSIGFLEIVKDSAIDRGYPASDFREHSFLTGRATALLAQLHGKRVQGEEFVAGLVHDVGQLLLLRAFPDIIAERGEKLAHRCGRDLVRLEEELFGVGHPAAGGWAAREWSLPPEIVRAIEEHHADVPADHSTDLGALVSAGDRLAHWFTAHPGASLSDATVFPEEWRDDAVLGCAELTPVAVGEQLGAELEGVL